MRRLRLMGLVVIAVVAIGSCDLFAPRQAVPNMPTEYEGRSVEDQGDAYVESRNVEIYAWDSGQVDGDIVTVIVNGQVIFDEYTLTGIPEPRSVTLDNRGYNYILLYAHNEGSVSPNTAAIDLDDGSTYQNLVLSANLTTNGAMDIVVQ